MSEALPAARGGRLWAALPIAAFVALAGLGAWGLFGHRATEKMGAERIGEPAPEFVLPRLGGGDPVRLSDYRGRPVLVNFFASWCAPCRVEHPVLMQLAKDGRLVIVGVAYKDDPADTQRFLLQLGDPFDAEGLDPDGETGIDFGITGVPETYLIGADGRILAKKTGPLEPQAVAAFIAPALAAAPPASTPR